MKVFSARYLSVLAIIVFCAPLAQAVEDGVARQPQLAANNSGAQLLPAGTTVLMVCDSQAVAVDTTTQEAYDGIWSSPFPSPDKYSPEEWHKLTEPVVVAYVKSGGKNKELVESALECPYASVDELPPLNPPSPLEKLLDLNDTKSVPALVFILEHADMLNAGAVLLPQPQAILDTIASMDNRGLLPAYYYLIDNGTWSLKVYIARYLLARYSPDEKAMKTLEAAALPELRKGYSVPPDTNPSEEEARRMALYGLSEHNPRWRQYFMKAVLEDKSDNVRSYAIRRLVDKGGSHYETDPAILDMGIALMMNFASKNIESGVTMIPDIFNIAKMFPEKQRWIIDEIRRFGTEYRKLHSSAVENMYEVYANQLEDGK